MLLQTVILANFGYVLRLLKAKTSDFNFDDKRRFFLGLKFATSRNLVSRSTGLKLCN